MYISHIYIVVQSVFVYLGNTDNNSTVHDGNVSFRANLVNVAPVNAVALYDHVWN